MNMFDGQIAYVVIASKYWPLPGKIPPQYVIAQWEWVNAD